MEITLLWVLAVIINIVVVAINLDSYIKRQDVLNLVFVLLNSACLVYLIVSALKRVG